MLTIALNLKSLLCVDYNATKNVVVEGSNFIFKLHGMQRGLASSPGHTQILLQQWRETAVRDKMWVWPGDEAKRGHCQ